MFSELYLKMLSASFLKTPLFRRCIEWGAWIPFSGLLPAIMLARSPAGRRCAYIFKLMQIIVAPWPQRCIIAGARIPARLGCGAVAVETYWLFVAFAAKPGLSAVEVVRSAAFRAVCNAHPENANLHIALAAAYYSFGDWHTAAHHFWLAIKIAPDALHFNLFSLKAAYANGLVLDTRRATVHFGQYYGFFAGSAIAVDQAMQEQFDAKLRERTIIALTAHFIQDFLGETKRNRYGVFFHSSTEALGHAILDPYYFLSLRKENYDRVFFLGPYKAAYRPAPAVCLSLIEQHVTYAETSDDALLNASWMNFGTIEGTPELCLEHYWSLLREAALRTRDPNDPFFHNAWHLELPEAIESAGRAFANHLEIDPGRSLVVLHARHGAYHALAAQAFRDVEIRNYVPAIRHLLESGYQVVRIGDMASPRLDIEHDNYLELLFHEESRPEYDPFFIAHADFMIGCQSGPCAYARVLGVPLLSVNAILNYTLLPARMEMACFKRYQLENRDGWTDIGLEEALAADVQHFDNTYQYEAAGMRLCDAQEDEILAAVIDMIDWLADPEQPMTAEQERFHAAVEAKSVELTERGATLEKPIADYLGIALPGYRLSPTVARMRETPKAAGARNRTG